MGKPTIIGGKYSSRKLVQVPGKARPTSARLRKALFDILGDITDIEFIDLFAGSGAVGIEALSRGANPVIFIEIERKHCRAIKRNIDAMEPRNLDYKIVCGDAMNYLRRYKTLTDSIIFASPPYIDTFLPRVLTSFEKAASAEYNNRTLFALQFPRRALPSKLQNEPKRIHTIGDNAILFWNEI